MSKSYYIIPIFVPHEGCPYNCVFCNQSSITGIHEVVDEDYTHNIIKSYLETIRNDNAVVEVSFFGGSFTAIDMNRQKSLLKVAKSYKDEGKIKYIRLSTRPDCIDREILNNLKEYGVDIIELGVQSLDNEVLKLSGRGHEEGIVYTSSKLIKEYGFTLGHQIMLGLPGDSFEKDIETTEKVISMKPDICRIYPALVVKNTPMEFMLKNNSYKPYSLNDAIKITKVIYGMLISNNIKVIRIGLQPTEEINEGKEIVQGPFHPAFRELVESSIMNDMIIENVPSKYNGEVIIEINNKDISKLYANKKEFFYDMIGNLKTVNFKVVQNSNIELGNLILKLDEKTVKMSMCEYIINKHKEGYLKLI
ncbi:histone acetyltransferase (RNA polymerase elongator complex component) [Clostridium pascui]|uniref:elongator complex protein 3 n=1 Tax=Clostridium pascui TaxID=46609 RepID=UPI00195DE213|nr:radical SAM protein [Clostridium pascui]MBM7868951.1 histone acetyltransferase (RNA polymerase elongator complex component) [Clostridium pascui]